MAVRLSNGIFEKVPKGDMCVLTHPSALQAVVAHRLKVAHDLDQLHDVCAIDEQSYFACQDVAAHEGHHWLEPGAVDFEPRKVSEAEEGGMLVPSLFDHALILVAICQALEVAEVREEVRYFAEVDNEAAEPAFVLI